MASFGNIMRGIIVFMVSTAFVYFTYPFFSHLLTALDNADLTIGLEGWGIVKIILWGGYWFIVLLMVFVIPIITIAKDNAD